VGKQALPVIARQRGKETVDQRAAHRVDSLYPERFVHRTQHGAHVGRREYVQEVTNFGAASKPPEVIREKRAYLLRQCIGTLR
jgi:hypothetical protein